MSDFDWDDEKNELLKSTRGVSFEDVVFHIQNGDVLDIIKHSHATRYPKQNVIVLNDGGLRILGALRQGKRHTISENHYS